ncbi:MAG: hypothetical protein RLZZ165_2466 [Bacteroidota bacterium]
MILLQKTLDDSNPNLPFRTSFLYGSYRAPQ